ncbi:MAG: putative DNA binding domain-containing protein [Clostridia bacterium]|nr:putative DNA binding domain-containing protein [Clostridia bacterium]
MAENQNIEYKEAWRDEYLKWICGFANAQGGTIYIGIDDAGNICGVNDSKKLLEDIPNKVKNKLGIIVDVNLHTTDKGDYIEIIVEPQPYPISYYGEYHYRAGSTKQQLTGQQLNQFLLKKTGITWDSIPVPNISVDKIRNDAFDIFKEQAVKNGRMLREDVDSDNFELLDNLNLIDENGYIKKAGILLFHHNPEKWVPGAFIKIAYFATDAELEFQDEIHGPLIAQPDKIMDLLYTKYLKAKISYEGITRIESYPYPKSAVREAILNAIAHKNYATLVPIQIRVYKDRLIISNDCVFPEDWTVEDLLKQHKSRPYNPLIANAFYRAGFIESWGRGIQKIKDSCIASGCNEPEYQVKREDFAIVFKTSESNESYTKCNESQAKSIESKTKSIESVAKCIESINNSETGLSKKAKERLLIIVESFADKKEFDSGEAAEVLGVSEQVARKLLRKADELEIVRSKGKTKDKKYFFEHS